MAKKEQSLLENIFDAASVIEESIVGTAGTRSRPYSKGLLGPLKDELKDRWDTIRLAKAHGGTRDAVNEFKNIVKDDLGNASYMMKKKAKAVGGHINANKSAYGAGLLGLGAGVAAKSLYDNAHDIADTAGEHIHSLRDKLAGLIATHHEA
jgi:hypothetical protein